MSFNISARGVGHIGRDKKFFQYDQRECIDGDDFETMQLVADISKIKPTIEGIKDAVKDKIKDEAKDKLKEKFFPTPSIIDATSALGRMILIRTLVTQIAFLAMHSIYSRKHEAYIFITARKSNLLFPDDYEVAKYIFDRHDPGTEFIKKIAPALKKTDMNNYGVLREFISVFKNYDEMISRNQTPQLMIEVWK